MINIVYSCDSDFLDWVGISIASVVENNKEEDIHFYIASEKDNSAKLNIIKDFYKNNKKINISYIDCMMYDKFLEEHKCDKWGSKSYYTYWQLFAFDLLDCKYAWYLDSDIICLNKIENPKLDEDKVIGGVLDSAHAFYSKTIGLKKEEYFYNAGVFFVDVEKWKRNKCTQKCIDYIAKVRSNFTMADQDLFSLSLQNETQLISPKFDYLCGYDYYGIDNSFKMYSLNRKPFYNKDNLKLDRKEIIFYHCLNGVFGRPWENDNEHPLKDEYNYYKMNSAFPNFYKERRPNTLIRIEKKLEILPNNIYCIIHNMAQICYIVIRKFRVNYSMSIGSKARGKYEQ